MSAPARWRRRLAAHLSIGSLDTPAFAATARSLDPVDQIDAAAAAGFSAVCDNMLLARPVDDQVRMARALARTGLELGSLSLSPLGPPQLVLADAGADVAAAVAAAADGVDRMRAEGAIVGSLTAMVHAATGDRDGQLEQVARNLEHAAAVAASRGVRLGLEGVSRERMPSSLVVTAAEAASLVTRVGSPALGLVVDSAHAWYAGDDLADLVREHAELLVGIQIADMPGRVEPGAGVLDFGALDAALDLIGWDGLVEVESFASAPGVAGEAAVLAALDRLFAEPTAVPARADKESA